MTYVWVIATYSTGERWNTMVCDSSESAARVLHGYAMTREHGNDESEYQGYCNLRDLSQTAVVRKVILIQ